MKIKMATASGHLHSIIVLGSVSFITSLSGVSAAAECFYHLEQIDEFRFQGSFFSDHGCCGTTENQRCSKEEEWRTWKIVAIVMACVVGTILLALLCYWLLKKQNKKTMRVRHTENRLQAPANIPTAPNSTEIFAMSHLYDTPPPYSSPMYTELPYDGAGQSSSDSGVCLPNEEPTDTRQSIQTGTTAPPPDVP